MVKPGKTATRSESDRVTRGQLIGRITRFLLVVLFEVYLVHWVYVNMTAVDSIQVRHILVEGNFQYLNRTDVENYFTNNYNHYNLLTMDLNEVRTDIEGLSWVKGVYLRKMLPDVLVINIEEHVPVAYYNQGVLTQSGRVVYPELKLVKEDFIHLYGPEGRGEEVFAQYQRMNDFLSRMGFTIGAVELTGNFLWRVYLTNGIVLHLGSSIDDNLDELSSSLSGENVLLKRLRRFVEAYPHLENQAAIQYIDLRYQTGFAVKWKAESEAQEDASAGNSHEQPTVKRAE